MNFCHPPLRSCCFPPQFCLQLEIFLDHVIFLQCLSRYVLLEKKSKSWFLPLVPRAEVGLETLPAEKFSDGIWSHICPVCILPEQHTAPKHWADGHHDHSRTVPCPLHIPYCPVHLSLPKRIISLQVPP